MLVQISSSPELMREAMKILFVTRDKFPPFRPAAAAVFREELPKRGHSIDWLAQSATASKKDVIAIKNGKVYVGSNTDRKGILAVLLRNIAGFLNYLRVFWILRSNDYDLVQVKDLYFPALVVLLSCKINRIPFCYWLAYPHGESSIYKSKNGMTRHRVYYYLRGHLWRWVLYRILLPAADHIFVQSEQMKLDLAKKGADPVLMTPIPGSLNLADIPYPVGDAQPDKSIALGQFAVLYLGTLSRVRHLDFLLRSFSRVLLENRNARLFMLGKGDEPEDDEYLKEVAEELGISDSVVFTGHLPMNQAWQYIRSSAVCVSPYFPTPILNSTSPTKLIEYMAMARPVIGNDHPEQRLVISQSGAGICVPYDESKFAEAIIKILSDPDTANKMGKKGREFVECYRTNSVMADIVEQTYESIGRLNIHEQDTIP